VSPRGGRRRRTGSSGARSARCGRRARSAKLAGTGPDAAGQPAIDRPHIAAVAGAERVVARRVVARRVASRRAGGGGAGARRGVRGVVIDGCHAVIPSEAANRHITATEEGSKSCTQRAQRSGAVADGGQPGIDEPDHPGDALIRVVDPPKGAGGLEQRAVTADISMTDMAQGAASMRCGPCRETMQAGDRGGRSCRRRWRWRGS